MEQNQKPNGGFGDIVRSTRRELSENLVEVGEPIKDQEERGIHEETGRKGELPPYVYRDLPEIEPIGWLEELK